jgi:menaquinol-cytochrome c reductase iron-sulfur subunit
MNDSSPESETPEAMRRRKFLMRACSIVAAPLAVAIGYPLAASLVGTIYRQSKLQFSKAPGFDSAPEGQPIKLNFTDVETDAYMRTVTGEDVWVIKHGPAEATVFSPVCPHMGCRYNWQAESKQFICPCHGSVFSPAGKVLGGPSPRSLDTLPHKIENGALYVQWEQFQTGLAKKVRV